MGDGPSPTRKKEAEVRFFRPIFYVIYFLPPSRPVRTLPSSSAASSFWAVDFFLEEVVS